MLKGTGEEWNEVPAPPMGTGSLRTNITNFRKRSHFHWQEGSQLMAIIWGTLHCARHQGLYIYYFINPAATKPCTDFFIPLLQIRKLRLREVN